MSSTYVGHSVTSHRHARPRIPALVEDTGELAAYRARQTGELPPRPLPRVTWLHGAVGAITAAIGVWFTADLVGMADHPEVVSGHLRGALTGSAAILAVMLSNHRLYRRIERLHDKTRHTTEWWAARARVIDQRDAEFRAGQHAIADQVSAIARMATDDLAATRRAVVEQRQDLVDIARGLGYASGRIRTLSQEVISVGGGQAAMMEVLEHLARIVGQLSERQQRAAGDDPGDGQLGSDEVRRAYHLGEREARDSNIVAMPNAKAFELGRQIERRRWEQGRDDPGNGG